MRPQSIAAHAVAIATMFALLAAPGFAQGTSSGATGANPTNNSTSSNAADQSFVQEAIKANDQEIDEAQAQLKSTNDPSIRMFAQRMIKDHTAANAQIAAVAKNFNMQYPSSHVVNDQGGGAQNQMNGPQSPGSPPPAATQPNTAAATSAREYMQKEVQDHQQAIALFENEVKNGSPQFKTLAGTMLPELRAHLAMAQQYTNTGRITMPVETPTPAANPPR